MANRAFDNALKYGSAALAVMDLRVLLVMTNTSIDPDPVTPVDFDAATIADIGTLDECDASGYTAGGVALSGESSTVDTVLHAAKLGASPATFTGLNAGTRDNAGMLVYRFNATLGGSEPLFYFDDVGGDPTFPFAGNGTDVIVTPNGLGLARWQNAA